ncbi:MAG TPA: bifunctional serine/threonine-protein kinase/formylglycine-generating enzyme family protein [Myxococcota bacterium]|nr:bifunctional serine/threonine-protein kinase/formylglycine-generating enzyme family protein [Myxococcota bacterium]HRV18497.1 bifunctional serine/threonine-protein kinase/formylglycine-generating enzyme family protein [Myxococcota bacterium]
MPDSKYCLHCCLEHSRCTCDAVTKAQPVENHLFSLPAGAILAGQYRIGRVLGAGGFGITYLAVNEDLGLRVAIKEYMPRSDAVRGTDRQTVLPGTAEDREAFEFGLEKFVEEARVLARISEKDNPRIVSILNFFRSNGTAYLVMRYLEGQTLASLLKSRGGSLGEEEAMVYLTAMLDGLREIHGEGLIHRDIKPHNVFITNDGGVKLIDFGAARYAQGAKSRGLTQVYTPPYAPFEQYSQQGNQGPWTDLYAVGVTFYQMLTGRLPSDALSRLQDPSIELPNAVTGGKVSKALDTVVAKALNPEVGKRFRSVDEFFQALSLPSSVKLGYQEPAKQDDRAAVEARKREEERIAAENKAEEERIARERAAAEKARAEKARAEKARAEKAAKEEQERQRTSFHMEQRVERVELVVDEPYQVKESYYDVVVVQPGGLFRKEQTEVVTKTRMVTKTRPVKREIKEDHLLIVNGLGEIFHTLRFVHIPAGTFMMGSPKDEDGRYSYEKQHKVTLTSPFEMMVTPVTQSLWQFVMGNNPSHFKGPDLPVERVSWNDVQDFIQKLNQMLGTNNLRLPTEAEWEYACRAGTTGARYGELDKIAWYGGNSGSKTHPVGTKAPNAWGLYDMLGNVWEWCQDWYGDYPSGSVTDPTGPSTGSARVDRGGSWSDSARGVRAADRSYDDPGYRLFILGLRLARSVR